LEGHRQRTTQAQSTAPPNRRGTSVCSICKQEGHNRRTCPEATTSSNQGGNANASSQKPMSGNGGNRNVAGRAPEVDEDGNEIDGDEDLDDVNLQSRARPTINRPYGNRKRQWWNHSFHLRHDQQGHFPCKYGSRKERSGEVKGSDYRETCKVCQVKCSYRCRLCGVALCIEEEDETKVGCWERFHTFVDFTVG
jgi:hypothetical protein